MGYVVKVDDRGRIKLPKNIAKADSVIIIDVGTFFIGIPIPKDPLAETSGVIETNLSVKELKEVAEKEAEKDALGRHSK
ncbi:MAG: VapB-type antitoxin [Sulfolobaceae archaeon]